MTIYLTNAFSPSMVNLPVDISFTSVDKNEFCQVIADGVFNAIGHQGTIDFLNMLCNSQLKINRVSIKATIGDVIYVVMLSVRLEEGKVLDSQEVKQWYNEGKIMLLKAKVYGSVLEQLAECQGICEEKQYDALAYRARNGGEVEREVENK
jgi:hypothetical protein